MKNALFVAFGATTLLAAATIAACVVGGSPSGTNSSLCTCSSTEKYDDTSKSCVASAAFTAPTNCKDDGAPVCGCDGTNYTSECAAYAVGVEVQYAGNCTAGAGGGQTGGGFGGFGW